MPTSRSSPGFSLHEDRATAIRNGQEGFEFFGYAMSSLVTRDQVPGRTNLWGEFQERRDPSVEAARIAAAEAAGDSYSSCIGTPADARRYVRDLADVGVDQLIFIQQCGRNRHADICSSLQLFADEVLPEFQAEEAARQRRKDEELAPFIEAALARKEWMQPLADDEIPVVRASVAKVQAAGRLA